MTFVRALFGRRTRPPWVNTLSTVALDVGTAKERRTASISLSCGVWLCFRDTNKSEELSDSVYSCSASRYFPNSSAVVASVGAAQYSGQYTVYAQVGYQFFIHVLYGWIKCTWKRTCRQNFQVQVQVQVLGFQLSSLSPTFKSKSKSKSSKCKSKSKFKSSTNGIKSGT